MIELSLGVVIGILFILLLIFLLSGIHIAFGLIAVGIIGIYSFLPHSIIGDAARQAWNQLNSYTLTAVVLYIFMGEMVLRSGISGNVFGALNKCFGKLAGSLLYSVIGMSAFFAAVSGSSVASAAAIGTVAIPEMKGLNYNKQLMYGTVVGGGALGILIPPSVIMILYGALAGVSIAKCFLGGMLPGAVLVLMYILYVYLRTKWNPSLAPLNDETFTWREKLRSILDMMPVVILAIIVLGGIYVGIYTPTEAAGVGCAVTFIIIVISRRFSWKMLTDSLRSTIYTSSMIFLILAGAAIVSYVVNYLRIPIGLVEWINTLGLGPYTVLVFVCLMYYILGCFVDGISICIITVPIVFPVMMELGFDPVWLGIILTINIEVSLITPPLGLNLFVVKGIDSESRFDDIFMGAVPYVGMMTLMIVILTLFPGLATWLPNLIADKF